MIQGEFKRETDGRIISFELSGHANASPYGSDIVCAATSALAFSAVNGIEALAGFEPLVTVDDVEEGFMRFETLEAITQEQSNISQILLENLLLGLQSIQKEHSEFITIKTITKK